MPKLKSSKKRLRINRKAQLRNRAIRSRMRTAIKSVEQAEDKQTAEEALKAAFGAIDKTAKHHKIHKNMAARYKSQLARRVNALS